jgi:hypothetical protein
MRESKNIPTDFVWNIAYNSTTTNMSAMVRIEDISDKVYRDFYLHQWVRT